MKFINKSILVLLIFLFIVLIKTTVFAVTLTEVEYNGVTYKPDVVPLTLKTKTNSYIIAISNDLNTISVCEPYYDVDYLVLLTATSESSGTYNRIRGYATSSNTLTDVVYYTSTCSNGTWSDWSSSSVSSTSIFAPGNNLNILVSKKNVALYCSGLGIVGTDVISSGISLPNDIKFTDNFTISGNYLFYSPNSGNFCTYMSNTGGFQFYTSTPSLTNFDIYKYNSTSKTFEFERSGNGCSSGTSNIAFSHNKVRKYYYDDGTKYLWWNYAAGNFFDFYYLYQNFPYITNTAEDLAKGGSSCILILPGDFKSNEDIEFNIYSVEERNLPDGSTYEYQDIIFNQVLNATSQYYKSIDNEFWYEIPLDNYQSLMEKGKQYIFNISYNYNDKDYSYDTYVTWGGLTQEDIEKNEQLEEIKNQTQKIEEQTQAIKDQTEAIKEQHETSKSILGKIGDILSYLNPFSENFFAYKLVELIINGLKSLFEFLFIPDSEYFNNWLSDINDFFASRFGMIYSAIDYVVEFLTRLSSVSSNLNTDYTIHIPAFEFFGATLIPNYDYNLSDLLENDTFNTVHTIYLCVVDVIMYLWLIILADNTFAEIFGGRFIDEIVGVVQSDKISYKKYERHQSNKKRYKDENK